MGVADLECVAADIDALFEVARHGSFHDIEPLLIAGQGRSGRRAEEVPVVLMGHFGPERVARRNGSPAGAIGD